MLHYDMQQPPRRAASLEHAAPALTMYQAILQAPCSVCIHVSGGPRGLQLLLQLGDAPREHRLRARSRHGARRCGGARLLVLPRLHTPAAPVSHRRRHDAGHDCELVSACLSAVLLLQLQL